MNVDNKTIPQLRFSEFDEKYNLEAGTTMWNVARKMEGGEPNKDYMRVYQGYDIVGILTGNTGIWVIVEDFTTKLSVEDVLYRSEDGLTLDELSKIQGAFDEGKEYECVWANKDSCASKGSIYTTNGNGIVIKSITCNRLNLCKFKPVTNKPKPKWVPGVGDEVMTSCGKVIVKFIKGNQACVEFGSSINTLSYIEVVQLSHLMQIDKVRERVIKNCCDTLCNWDKSTWNNIGKLYDAGMLKGGVK